MRGSSSWSENRRNCDVSHIYCLKGPMVRKQLREKSAKSSWRGGALRVVKKVPISKTEPTPLNPAKLSRYWFLFAI